MPYLEARDGTRLFYLDCGEGMPVVLVSSAWLNYRMWDRGENFHEGHSGDGPGYGNGRDDAGGAA